MTNLKIVYVSEVIYLKTLEGFAVISNYHYEDESKSNLKSRGITIENIFKKTKERVKKPFHIFFNGHLL